MLDKGNSNTGSAMVIEKSPTKRSTSEGKPFTKNSHGEYCTYCKQSGHTKDTYYKRYGKEKEEMDRLRALLNSTNKPLSSCGLTMNGKSSFNISSSVPQSIWILDSRATNHMTPFSSYFTSYLKVSKKKLIIVVNGDHVSITGFGNIQLHSSLSLHNVLHVPKLANNLISIHRLKQDWNCAVTFFHYHCVIQELITGRTIGIGNNTNKEELSSSQRATSKTWVASQIWLYHKRLGHPPFGLLKTMFPHLFTKESVESFKCDICQFSKHHRATFSPSSNKRLEPFDLIHFDLVTLGAKWFVSFIDDCTCVTWIFLMKHKYEVCQTFVIFFRLVKNQFNKFIKRLWSNNGIKFVNLEFSKFLKDNGVVHELMYVNTPNKIGLQKGKIVTSLKLLEPSSSKCLSLMYIGRSCLNCHLSHQQVTYSGLKRLPSRVFGCVAFVHSHNPHHRKLDPRVVKCVFIGYPSNKKGFKCYHPPSCGFFVSMDVTFHETQSYFVCPPLQGESYLEVESVIESLLFSTQDV
ncbi:hypothetical protein CR513_37383, partial [Mucuna pruriens]